MTAVVEVLRFYAQQHGSEVELLRVLAAELDGALALAEADAKQMQLMVGAGQLRRWFNCANAMCLVKLDGDLARIRGDGVELVGWFMSLYDSAGLVPPEPARTPEILESRLG